MKLFYILSKNLLRSAWSPDGRYLSAGSADKYLYIWDFEDGKIAYKLPGHLGSINDVAFHPAEPISKLTVWLLRK
jgi:Prp8 binding protein